MVSEVVFYSDQKTDAVIDSLMTELGCKSKQAALRAAIAITSVVIEFIADDGTLIVLDQESGEYVKITLPGFNHDDLKDIRGILDNLQQTLSASSHTEALEIAMSRVTKQ